MSSFCAVCKTRFASRSSANDDGSSSIKCSKCENCFHLKCVNLSEDDWGYYKSVNKSWFCSDCEVLNRSVRYISPLKSASDVSFNLQSVNTSSNNEALLEAINKVTVKLDFYQNEQNSRHFAMMKQFNDRFLALETALLKIKDLSMENDLLKKSMAKLEVRLNHMEQKEHNATINITGVPVINDENVTDTVLKILNTGLESNFERENIVHCYRTKKTENKNISVPVIVVKFRDEQFKRSILKLKTKRKEFLSTKHLFNDEVNNRPIFINESLTPAKRNLLNDAINVKKELKYSFLWTRNGVIYMRKDKSSAVQVINCVEDLKFNKKFPNSDNYVK